MRGGEGRKNGRGEEGRGGEGKGKGTGVNYPRSKRGTPMDKNCDYRFHIIRSEFIS